MPRPGFHRMVLDLMRNAERAMAALRDFILDPSLRSGARFEDARKKAGACGDAVVRALDEDRDPSAATLGPSCFLNGFSRADLFRLARTLEKMLDSARSAVQDMLAVRVEPDVFLREMADAEYESCRYLAQAWRVIQSHPRRSSAYSVQAKKCAGQAAKMSQQAAAGLLKNSSVLEKMKTHEVYREFSDVAECCDVAAGLIGDILVQLA